MKVNKDNKILIIEDDDVLRETLLKALQKEKYLSDGARDSKEALALAKRKQYDLIISDVRLHGDDGVEMIRKIKESSSMEIGSIVITGYADESASIKAIDVKVDKYIKKPFDLDYFLAQIKQILNELERVREDKSYIKERKEAQRKHQQWGQENINLKDELCDLIVDTLCVEKVEIRGDSNFRADLGADSIDISELMVGIENKFHMAIDESKASELETVQGVFDYIQQTNNT